MIDQQELSGINKTRSEIFLVMNQLTMDSYDTLKDWLIKHLENFESCQLLIQLLIEKALNEKLFTLLYCKLI